MVATRLLFLVLLGLLAGDSMVAGAAPALGGCDATTLAAEVAVSCAAGAATPACCEAVVASVVLGGGDCLCAVAHEKAVLHAGLNFSSLVALHASCGGARVVTACRGAQAVADPVAAIDTSASSSAMAAADPPVGAVPPASSPSLPETPAQRLCNATFLAKQIVDDCRNPSREAECCDAVVAVYEIPSCLCKVATSESKVLESFTAYSIVDSYHACVGSNVDDDDEEEEDFAASCYGAYSHPKEPSPPPPAAPTAQPVPSHPIYLHGDRWFRIIIECGGLVMCLVSIVQLAPVIYRYICKKICTPSAGERQITGSAEVGQAGAQQITGSAEVVELEGPATDTEEPAPPRPAHGERQGRAATPPRDEVNPCYM